VDFESSARMALPVYVIVAGYTVASSILVIINKVAVLVFPYPAALTVSNIMPLRFDLLLLVGTGTDRLLTVSCPGFSRPLNVRHRNGAECIMEQDWKEAACCICSMLRSALFILYMQLILSF
jgi:hypothetical protein